LNPIDDIQLLKNYAADGNNHWLGILFKKYQSLLYGVCYKYLQNSEDAKDGVMEIFEKLHLDIGKLDIQHPKSYLYKIAVNHCLMKIRKAGIKYEYKDILQEGEAAVEWAEIGEDREDSERHLQQLQNCMNKLKEEQKHCVELFYYQEKSYKEIELQTGWNFKEVKTYIQNGKLNLKKCMQNG
jgi:RNA polymerase sigma-70 factor (ECF subfamily)